MNKRKWNKDAMAFLGIPLVIWVLGIGGLITGIAVWNITQRPDVTYNISDTGFSIAGVDVSWFAIIGVIALFIIIFIWWGRKKPSKPETIYIRENK